MSGIHPTAIVDSRAELAGSVEVGPYCVVQGPVRIGAGSVLEAHVVVTGNVVIGRSCHLFSFSAVGFPPQDRSWRGEEGLIEIGDENVFREHVTVHPGTRRGRGFTRIGSRNWLLAGAHVAHDCAVGDDVTIANGSLLAGHVEIGSGVMLSGLVGVHQYCRIGRLALVSAFTGVKQDIPPFTVAHGARSRLFGLNRVGLRRAGFTDAQLLALRTAYRLLFRQRGVAFAERLVSARRIPAPAVQELVDFIASSKRGVSRDDSEESEEPLPESGEPRSLRS